MNKSESSFSRGASDDLNYWPDWLPHDWRFFNELISEYPYFKQIYFNPEKKIFNSKEEVVQFLGKQKQAAKRVEEDSSDLTEKWPDWLPQDWMFTKSVQNPAKVYYSNPEGKVFRSKEEVVQFLAKLEVKRIAKRLKWKNEDSDDTSEDMDFERELELEKWPAWLPEDWTISAKYPATVSYFNSKGEKFSSKDEVVQFLAKKAANRVTKKLKRKIEDSNGV